MQGLYNVCEKIFDNDAKGWFEEYFENSQ